MNICKLIMKGTIPSYNYLFISLHPLCAFFVGYFIFTITLNAFTFNRLFNNIFLQIKNTMTEGRGRKRVVIMMMIHLQPTLLRNICGWAAWQEIIGSPAYQKKLVYVYSSNNLCQTCSNLFTKVSKQTCPRWGSHLWHSSCQDIQRNTYNRCHSTILLLVWFFCSTALPNNGGGAVLV